ncbi:MAG: hypothetical protein O2860_06430 [Chloroflexi bacterium]|nr:hypothetical protein [Chloroflexota bacterium]
MAEITDVLAKLLERTNENKVNWQSTSDENTFVAVLGNLSVSIGTLGEWDERVVLHILNREGRVIESLVGGTGQGNQYWTPDLYDLHTKAKRVSLGVDSQLDELLAALDEDPDDLPF